MSTKILTGTYTAGYSLVSPVTILSIASHGYVGGQGVHSGSLGAYTVVNEGTVEGRVVSGAGYAAISLKHGGTVINGASNDNKALLMSGEPYGVGIAGGSGTVENFGTLETQLATAVQLSSGGVVTNGSLVDTAAYIDAGGGMLGGSAVYIAGAPGTITNYGRIVGYVGVAEGGNVVNGAAQDLSAVIDGGISLAKASGTILNFGTISARDADAASLLEGGTVINGSDSDTKVLLDSNAENAVAVYGQRGTITNFGGIGGGTHGIYLNAGGKIINGSAQDTSAYIVTGIGMERGAAIIVKGGAGTVVNFGAIDSALELADGGSVTNGSAADSTAGLGDVTLGGTTSTLTNFGQIEGSGVVLNGSGKIVNGSDEDRLATIDGVYLKGADTVTNFGTINGLITGASVIFKSTEDDLLAEGGSVFVGRVNAGRGTIDAVSGVAHFTSGIATEGSIIGAGAVSLEGGNSAFAAGTDLAVAEVEVSGAATRVYVEGKLSYVGAWSQASGALTVNSGDRITFSGVGDRFSGVLAGAGSIVFAGGADTLEAATLSVHRLALEGAGVTLAGVIDLTGEMVAAGPDIIVASGGAILSGGGVLEFSGAAGAGLRGAAVKAMFTNMDDRIVGGGEIGGGSMILDNAAAGLIEDASALALVIDTGGQTVINAGRIEALGAGGVTIASAVENSGTLVAAGGALTVERAVSGSGEVRITKGRADFTAAFSQDVIFGAGGGELDLAQSTAYAATLRGFTPKAGATILDLADIAFGAATKASYSGTAQAGVLTVTDGSHTARFKLAGDTVAPTVTVSSDGHGGTRVTDAFVAAMAGFAPPAGGAAAAGAETPRAAAMLASPQGS
jgi:hypothetical protein